MVATKGELFELIRRDSRHGGLSVRALAGKYGVHRRLVREALMHAEPDPRKTPDERDLNECRCRRRCVGSLTVPSKQHAVRGIYFDEAAHNYRPIEVEVERLPHEWSCHRVPIILTRPAHIQEP